MYSRSAFSNSSSNVFFTLDIISPTGSPNVFKPALAAALTGKKTLFLRPFGIRSFSSNFLTKKHYIINIICYNNITYYVDHFIFSKTYY